MISLLLCPIALCFYSQYQQQLIDETAPIIISFPSTRTCIKQCHNLTDLCVSSVQPLCIKECQSAPDPLRCHHSCEEEGISHSHSLFKLSFSVTVSELEICGMDDVDCKDICLYGHLKTCQQELRNCQKSAFYSCQTDCKGIFFIHLSFSVIFLRLIILKMVHVISTTASVLAFQTALTIMRPV